MKKLLFSLLLPLLSTIPLLAQQDGNYVDDVVPTESLTLKRGNIPPAVLKTADELFKGNTQISWGVFPYELKDYGWTYESDYDQPIDHYEIHMHTKEGSEVYALFESTGEIIRSRISLKNASLPPAVTKAISNSQYKDWKIIEDTQLIRSNQKKVVDHYAIKFDKGNMRRTVYFSSTGEILKNK